METSKALIEVTMRRNEKLEQVLDEKNDRLINPNGKQVILYAPRYSRAADKQFEDDGIIIIRTLGDLFDCLRRL